MPGKTILTVNKFAYLIAERIRVHQAPVSTNNNLHGGDENELRGHHLRKAGVDWRGFFTAPRSKPVVCALQGWCLTLGIEIALDSDGGSI